MTNKLEKEIIVNFLKSGLTTRKLDKYLGHDPVITKGWISWTILKKYNLRAEDCGILFCFRSQECVRIVQKIMKLKDRIEIENILNTARPQHLEKYSGTYIIADTPEKVLTVLAGEVRNITQSFFSPLKKNIGSCQYDNCNNKDLDTVHLRKSRPEIFMSACEFGHIPNSKKYDVYKIMKQYLQLHAKKNSVCFLCKSHHNELGKYEKFKGVELKNFWSQIKE